MERALPPVDVVLLAGGRGARVGVPKGLVRVDGRPWLEHQLDAVDRLQLGGRCVVVLGFEAARHDDDVPRLRQRATIAVNPSPERGPFSSLLCGLERVAQGRSAFVLPVDVPSPAPAVWAALRAALGPTADAAEAAVPVHGARGGHPVLLAPAFLASLARLGPDGRLDVALRGTAAVARVAVEDASVLRNRNAPEDWPAHATGVPSLRID